MIGGRLSTAIGQRTYKSVYEAGVLKQTHFVYDGSKLLGEYDNTGVARQEIVWLGEMPIALIQDGTVFHIYTNQLNAPLVITDTTGLRTPCVRIVAASIAL